MPMALFLQPFCGKMLSAQFRAGGTPEYELGPQEENKMLNIFVFK